MPDLGAATLAERVAAGDFAPDVLDQLRDGMQAYVRADGSVSLERCLNLPRSNFAQRLARRDRALRRAAQIMARPTPRATYLALEAEWARFVAGPLWRAWRDDEAPPAGVSELHQLLFVASVEHRSSARGTLSARRLRDIVEGEV